VGGDAHFASTPEVMVVRRCATRPAVSAEEFVLRSPDPLVFSVPVTVHQSRLCWHCCDR
jgi:hypothetical protein